VRGQRTGGKTAGATVAPTIFGAGVFSGRAQDTKHRRRYIIKAGHHGCHLLKVE
jgi:hypothetical protein